MTRLETPNEDLVSRLRASLDERSTDVSASPQLWERVDDRITARRRTGMLALVGGTAMAVAVAAVVVPNMLEDRAPEVPGVTVEPSPSGEATPGTDAPPAFPAGAYPEPEYAVAVQGADVQVVRLADATIVGTFALGGGEPLQVAARPHLSGAPYEFAYLVDGPDGWAVHVATVPVGDLDRGFDGAVTSDVRVLNADAVPGALSPGVAWSPDGRFLAWTPTFADPNRTLLDVLDWTAYSQGLQGPDDVSGQFLLADGATAGQFTLKDWTWDHQFEDGRVGRVFLTGAGRSWQVEVIHSGGLMVEGLDPIDVADDFDQAGPDLGVYGLFADPRTSTYSIAARDGQENGFSFRASYEPADGAPTDFAVAGGHWAVATGSALFLGAPETTGTVVDNGARWIAVDLIAEAWIPIFQDEGGDPVVRPTDATDDPTPAALPRFIVTTDGNQIDLRWSDGRLIQTLVRANESDTLTGEVLGLDVRPGSSTEDLVVVGTVARDDRVRAFSLRGRADDQAGLSIVLQEWPEAYQPSPTAVAFADGERTIPVFSDDGRFVAFTENEPDSTGLKIFGWLPDADVPGTGRTADDNVAFGRGTVPATVESFTGPGPSRSGGDGYVIELTNADGTTSACEYDLQADGALAEIICEGDRGADGQVLELTNRVLLERLDGRIRIMGPEGQQWPMPAELELAVPEQVWMSGRDGHVFVGVTGGPAYLITVEGAQQVVDDLPAGVTWVSGVR